MAPGFDPRPGEDDPLVEPPDADPDFADIELPPLEPTDVAEEDALEAERRNA